MKEPIASAKTSSGRKRARLLVGTLALTMASFGAAVAVSAAPAIGTPGSAFTNVSVTPTAATTEQQQSYVITMTAPSVIPNGASIAVADNLGNHVVVTTVLTGVSLVDENAANCRQSGTNGGTATTSDGLVIVLAGNCNIAAGDTIEIGLTVTDPTSNFSFSVASTVNGTAVTSNSVTINSVPPAVSASPLTPGYGAIYTIAGIGTEPLVPWNSPALTVGSTTEPVTTLTVESPVTAIPTTANSIDWYSSANGTGYSVSYTPSTGPPDTDIVQSATVSFERGGDVQHC